MSRQFPPALRALNYRNYRLFYGGQIISLIGTFMQSVAQSWLIYRLTGSAILLGFVTFAGQFPVFLFASMGGVVADRYNRHRIILLTQTLSMLAALVLAILTLTNRIQIWHIFAIAICFGVINAFDIPARQAFVVDMVGTRDLMNAIALNSSMVNGARIVGPAVAGLLVAAVGEGWCFLLNGLSYVAVLIGLLLMQLPARESVEITVSAFEHVLEGFRFVGQARPIRALLLLIGLISLMGAPYAVLMPIFSNDIFHRGASGMGLLLGASGVGALIGAFCLATRDDVRGLGRWVALSSAGFGISITLFALSRYFWLSAAFLILSGFTMMVQMAASNTLIQTMSPDALRGRVMAVYSMMFMGMAPIGALLAGALAHHLGAPVTVMIGGVACILGAVVFALYLPSLRKAAQPFLPPLTNEMPTSP